MPVAPTPGAISMDKKSSMTRAHLRDPQVDALIFSLIIIALLPALNVVARELFLEEPHQGLFLVRAAFTTGIAVVLFSGWLFFRQPVRALGRSLFPRSRIGALAFFLTAAYFSQIFSGFWHPGIAGWTYESYSLERIEAKAENLEDSQNVPESHRTAIEDSFRPNLATEDGQSGGGFCWGQMALVVEFVPDGARGNQLVAPTVLTAESLGFVFPEYILRRAAVEPDGLGRLVNARIDGGQSPIPWDAVGDAISLPTWRYWSHTPAVGGMFDYSAAAAVISANYYSVISCAKDGAVAVTAIRQVSAK